MPAEIMWPPVPVDTINIMEDMWSIICLSMVEGIKIALTLSRCRFWYFYKTLQIKSLLYNDVICKVA
jgi:hypothetical protein